MMKLLMRLLKVKNSKFIDVFVGKGNSFMLYIRASEDHIGYYENLPIGMLNFPDEPFKIFENSKMFKILTYWWIILII